MPCLAFYCVPIAPPMYIEYDLDAHRITDFRLKPWASTFLVLRSALYEIESFQQAEGRSENQSGENGTKPKATSAPPAGLYALFVTDLSQAIDALLQQHYKLFPPITDRRKLRRTAERDKAIRAKFTAGITLQTLSKDFGLSVKRIYQIVKSSSGQ